MAKFTVQAYDNQGNYDEIEEWVDVQNEAGDSSTCLDIISPGENEHLAGMMMIEAVALDEEGIDNEEKNDQHAVCFFLIEVENK